MAYVAEVDGSVVGTCDVDRRSARTELSHVAVLGIAIRKEFRGRGIGQNLMRKTIEACRGKFEVIVLSVFSNNYPAKTLYEKLGFKMYGQLPRGIKRGDQYIDEELMYLSLT